jgi:hypothetical protein
MALLTGRVPIGQLDGPRLSYLLFSRRSLPTSNNGLAPSPASIAEFGLKCAS